VSLGTLLANLGVDVVAIAAAPKGLDVDVQGVTIHDPIDPVVEEGDLVLGVGIDPTSLAAVETVAALGRAGAVGLVVKGEAAALVEPANAAGTAVLVVPREMAWSQLHTLLRSARAAEGTPAAGAGDAPAGDLFALANAIASMVGGPTTIEDLHSTVLAYSSLDEPIDEPRRQTILGRRVPDEWVRRLQDDGVFRRLYTSPGPIRIDYREEIPGYANRLAIAVRAGDELLGSVWVAESSRPLGEEAESALRDAAPLAALHLLRSRAADDLERRRRGDLLRAVLDGRAAPEALGASLGLGTGMPVTVVDLELMMDEEAGTAAAAVSADRAVSLVMAEGAPANRPALLRFVSDLVTRTAESLRVPLRAAVGSTVPGAAELLGSQREAAAVLRAMPASTGGTGAVSTIDDVRSRVVLDAVRDLAARQPDLRDGKVAALVDHDREKGTEYVVTLRAYLDHFGDVPAAAASLHVHPNTFRYRLRRLVAVAGLDLDDPTERLVAHLQLTTLL